ncbi:MAG TPA: hypothetical protein VG388_00655, partial [Solirubrobacteraceae bacterium]|nr:hypothetical protein [Solirubrobacteraceae bacterium]
MNARDVEMAGADVDRSLHRVRRCLITSGVVAAIAGAAAFFSPAFAVALAVGSVVQASVAVVLWLCRRERIERLALDPAAYAIPAVARFGARACALRERRRLAAVMHAVVHERGTPLELHLGVRASHCAPLLETLARELALPAARVEAPMAVACRRLITRPVESPLYNPNLPEEDLRALLLRIRAGISSGGPGDGSRRH